MRDHDTPIEPDRIRAEAHHCVEVVAHEQHRATAALHLRHLAETFSLELGVADRQDLVDDHDFGVEVRRDCERQSQVHPGRVSLHRCVEEAFHAGECDDLVELSSDVASVHSEDRAVEVDVLPAGQLGVETGPHLQQGADSPASSRDTGRRIRNPRQKLQQRALPRTVAADHTERLALGKLEVHASKRPDLIMRLSRAAGEQTGQRLTECPPLTVMLAEEVALAEVFDLDRIARHQMMSANVRSVL